MKTRMLFTCILIFASCNPGDEPIVNENKFAKQQEEGLPEQPADEPSGVYSKNVIQIYRIANRVGITLYDMSDRTFSISFGGEDVYQINNDKYQNLAEKYGDVSYNGRIAAFAYNIALSNELKSIDIVSDSDYDILHPAGVPINDIVYLKGKSYYPYIKSGYEDKFALWNFDTGFDKRLKDLANDDLKLLDISYLVVGRFATPPTISQKHNITLTIVDTDGKKMTAKKAIDFTDRSMWIDE